MYCPIPLQAINKRHPPFHGLHHTFPLFSNNDYLAQEIYKVSLYDTGCHVNESIGFLILGVNKME